MTTHSLTLKRSKLAWKFPTVHLSRRSLQITLGVIWLIDAILQAQPWMFTKAFGETIIKASAMGQPAVIGKPLMVIAGIVIHYPQLNVIFMLVQFAIAFGILFSKRTLKPALLLSILWGVGVWYVGDGLGGIFSGGGSMLVGFPTAPILYSILGIALWPVGVESTSFGGGNGKFHWLLSRADLLFERLSGSISRISWSIIWIVGSLFAFGGSQFKADTISRAISASASASPSWLAALDRSVLPAVHSLGISLVLAIALLELAVGVLAFSSRSINASLWAGSILSLIYWIFGQSLGAITTGQSTDVNSAPLLVLVALAIYFHACIKQTSTLVTGVDELQPIVAIRNNRISRAS